MAVLSVVLRGFRVDEAIEIPGLNSRVAACDRAGNWNTVRIVQSFTVGTVLGSISNQPLGLDPTSIHDRLPNNAKRRFHARARIYGIPKYAILKPSTQPPCAMQPSLSFPRRPAQQLAQRRPPLLTD